MTNNVKQESARLYKCIGFDIMDNKDRQDMWEREIELVINQQVIQALERVKESDLLQGGLHFSHLCPPDSVDCARVSARGAMRNQLRSTIDNLIKEYKGE